MKTYENFYLSWWQAASTLKYTYYSEYLVHEHNKWYKKNVHNFDDKQAYLSFVIDMGVSKYSIWLDKIVNIEKSRLKNARVFSSSTSWVTKSDRSGQYSKLAWLLDNFCCLFWRICPQALSFYMNHPVYVMKFHRLRTLEFKMKCVKWVLK